VVGLLLLLQVLFVFDQIRADAFLFAALGEVHVADAVLALLEQTLDLLLEHDLLLVDDHFDALDAADFVEVVQVLALRADLGHECLHAP